MNNDCWPIRVWVTRVDAHDPTTFGIYRTGAEHPLDYLFAGTPEQVHSWLGRHGYHLVCFAHDSWLAGTYQKGVSHAA